MSLGWEGGSRSIMHMCGRCGLARGEAWTGITSHVRVLKPVQPGSSAIQPVLSYCLCTLFNKLREGNLPFYLCSENMVLGLRLEGRVRGGGGIPLVQNLALITACLLHGFHPRGWHGLQTRAMGEASKIKSVFIPTLVNERPW